MKCQREPVREYSTNDALVDYGHPRVRHFGANTLQCEVTKHVGVARSSHDKLSTLVT